MTNIRLSDVVGQGYSEFWNAPPSVRYVVCKGSRASKKSKTAALYVIWHLMTYPQSNALVIRKVAETLRNSVYSDLRWAIHRLGVDDYFTHKTSPLEIEYKPTGQKILFRGLDDPLKITSISVEKGVLNLLLIEEAYEIMKEEDFNMIDESIRGVLPEGHFKRIIVIFNPWNERHWLKARFFDKKDPSVLAMTTNYLCNEWLDDSDRQLFERMKRDNPRRYKVAGLGEWGISEGLIYENWKEEWFNVDDVRQIPGIMSAFGLDFGYSVDPAALFCGLIDNHNMKIYVFDEIYKNGLTNKMLYEEIYNKGYAKERIVADSAEPKSIAELWDCGLKKIQSASKGRDSVNNGIQRIQNYEIIIHPRCVNFLTEISNYCWEKDKFNKVTTKPVDESNHLMDAMRYAVSKVIKGETFSFD